MLLQICIFDESSKPILMLFIKIPSRLKLFGLFFWGLLLNTFCYSSTNTLQLDSVFRHGIKFYEQGNYKQAILIFEKCVKQANAENNLAVESNAYNNIGNCYTHTNEVEKSLQNYLTALKIAQKIDNKKRIAKCLKNIGALYSDTKNFEKAFNYFDQSLAVAKDAKDTMLVADCFNNKALIYDEQQNNYPKAIEFYTKALTLYEQLKNTERIGMVYSNLGVVYKIIKNYDQSVFYYNGALKIAQANKDSFMMAVGLNNLGNVYSLENKHQQAMQALNEALSISKIMGDKLISNEILDGIANEYSLQGNYKMAYDFRTKFADEKFKYFDAERTKQMADMETKYQTELKQREIDSLNLQKVQTKNDLLQADLKVQHRNLFLVVALLLFLAAGFGFLLYQRHQKVLLAKEKADAILQTELNERNRIARDMHDELGTGLSKINMAQIGAQQSIGNEKELQHHLTFISKSTTELVKSMGDLIWSLKSEDNTLEQFFAKIRNHSSEFLEEANIDFDINFPEIKNDFELNKEVRHQLFLVIKEALNNALKHSSAKHLKINATLENNIFRLQIADDGKGFDKNLLTKKGNGLANMKHRIESTGGEIIIESPPNKGTQINITYAVEKFKNQLL